MRSPTALSLLIFLLATPTAAASLRVGGQVLDGGGAPVTGARVVLAPMLDNYAWALAVEGGDEEVVAGTVSDEQGRFELAAPGSRIFKLVVRADGFVPMRYPLLPLTASVELPPLRLVADAGVVVEVTAGGKPAAGVAVAVEPRSAEPWRSLAADGWQVEPRRGRSDASGLVALPRAAEERVRARALLPGALPSPTAEGGKRVRLRLTPEGYGERRLELRDPAGAPVADVAVLAADGAWPIGRTDGAGRATVLAPEAAELLLLGPDGVRRSAILGNETTRLALPGVVAVTGTVWQGAGRALAGALAGALVWPTDDPGRFTFTDKAGRYRLAAAPGETVRIQIAAAGFASRRIHLTAGADGGSQAPTVALAPTLAVAGRAVATDGSPLAGVLVEAVPLPPAPRSLPLAGDRVDGRAVSDRAGRFTLPALHPEGRYEVVASRTGLTPARLSLYPVDPRRELRLVLAPSRAAHGRVVDRDGRSIAGAEVQLEPADAEDPRRGPATAVSGTGGDFALAAIPALTFDLTVRAPGFAPTVRPRVTAPAGAGAVDLGAVVLRPGAEIAGRVVDPEGRPLAGVGVHLVEELNRSVRQSAADVAREKPRAVSDEAGRFHLAELEPGRPVNLLLRRAEYLPERLAGVAAVIADTDAPRRPLTVVLRPAALLRGRVVDADGEPIVRARVEVRDQPPPAGTVGVQPLRAENRAATSTDEAGSFAVDGLAPGWIEVVATAAGFKPPAPRAVEIKTGQEVDGLELVLERGEVIEGTATSVEGSPIADVRVRLREVTASSDAAGAFRLAGVPAGPQVLFISHPEHEPQVKDVVVEPGVNLVDLVLAAGWPVSGRVVTENGDAVLGARVELRLAVGREEREYQALSDTRGAFALPRVIDGTYHLAVAREGYGTVEIPRGVQVAGAPVSEVEVVLPAGLAVFGRLLGVAEDELAAVRVDAVGEAGQGAAGTVDAGGHYEVRDLAPGVWRMRAVVGDGRRQAEARLVLAAGDRRVERDLDLGEGVTLSGRVLYDGEPLAEARLQLIGRASAVERGTLTDHLGAFRLENLATGPYWVSVASPRAMVTHNEELQLDSDREVEIEIATAQVSGRVVSAATEEPLHDALLLVQQLIGPAASTPASLITVATGGDGTFTLARLSAGQYRLTVRRDGYEPLEHLLTVAAGSDLDDLVLPLTPTPGLELTARLPNGGVPGSLTVIVLGPGGQPIASETRLPPADGSVRFGSVPNGTWQLLIGAPGTALARAVATVPGEPLDLVLTPAARVAVRVPELMAANLNADLTLYDSGGQPLLGLDSARQLRQSWDLPGGAGLVDGVPGGLWTLRATAADGRVWQQTVAVPEQGGVEVSLE